MSEDLHTCSYYCTRPACIKLQRDELRERQFNHYDLTAALELIAQGPRPDGTYNRDRAACQQLALVALGKADA